MSIVKIINYITNDSSQTYEFDIDKDADGFIDCINNINKDKEHTLEISYDKDTLVLRTIRRDIWAVDCLFSIKLLSDVTDVFKSVNYRHFIITKAYSLNKAIGLDIGLA